MFKMFYRGAPASLEQGTKAVPDDGKYHLILDGQIVKSFRSLQVARQAYQKLLADVGFEPEVEKEELDPEQARRRERLAVDYYRVSDYWDEAHHHRRGGKLRKDRVAVVDVLLDPGGFQSGYDLMGCQVAS